ncbi:MAG: hypothetical protein ACI4D9_03915 [Lachnospiraceae bacterium]
MSFWSTEFMSDRRKQWLNSLVKFQYRVNGTWKDATVNDKRIEGNTLVIVASFPRSGSAETITGIRIIDVTGKQCGYTDANLVRTKNQGAATKFEFPIYEKEA